jgi:hypothetical protein
LLPQAVKDKVRITRKKIDRMKYLALLVKTFNVVFKRLFVKPTFYLNGKIDKLSAKYIQLFLSPDAILWRMELYSSADTLKHGLHQVLLQVK